MVWTATLVANVGVWMQSTAAGWLMTTLAHEPRMVALVQVASALPMFLLGLPAGALADIFDRRRLLLTMEGVGTALAAGFAVLVAKGLATPVVLLGFVFLASAAAAAIAPAWQAIVPQLVETKEDLAPAVALDSVSVNISRAVGPALAGAIIGAWGMAAPFSLYAVFNLACIAALFWWHPAAGAEKNLPPEHFGNAILVGLRHARYNRPLRATLTRAGGFFLFASTYWALLPLVAREQLAGGPGTYGLLLGAIGIGAVVGTTVLPRLKGWLGADRLVDVGSAGTTLALLLFALARQTPVALVAGALAGWSSIAVLSTLQRLGPRQRCRDGCAAAGWQRCDRDVRRDDDRKPGVGRGRFPCRACRSRTSPPRPARCLRCPCCDDTSCRAGRPGPDAVDVLAAAVDRRRGRGRPRSGARDGRIPDRGRRSGCFPCGGQPPGRGAVGDSSIHWGVFEDTAKAGRWLETFVVDSWLGVLARARAAYHADRDLNEAVLRFQQGDPPRVTHLVAP